MTIPLRTPPGFSDLAVPVKRIDAVASTHVEKIHHKELKAARVFHYSIPNVQEHGGAVVEDGSEIDSDKLVLEKPSVLISKLNPRKATACLTQESSEQIVASTEFVPIKARRRYDNTYLYYVLISDEVTSHLSSIVTSATRSHQRVHPTDITALGIPWPEQQARREIAEFLDHETAEIDAFIADLQAFKSMLHERRSARRDALVTGGRPRTSTGYTWLGEYEAFYTEGRMKNVFEITLGKMLDSKSHGDADKRYPYLRAANISNGTIDFDELNEMPFNARERERFSIKRGDILVVEGGSVGENAVIEQDLEDVFFQKTINRARPKHGNDSYYFSQVLEAYLDREVFGVVCNKSTIMHLTADKLGDLEVPIPRPDMQRAISKSLADLNAEVRLASSDVETAIALASERRSALISAAVTGQIDVSDRYAAEKVYEEVESKQ